MKDFFDEEYEKQQEKNNAEEDMQNRMKDWYSSGAATTREPEPSTRSPWYFALIVVALVLAIVLGWVLCSIFSNSSEASLLANVMKFMDENYYKEISDAEMQKAIAAAGTAMLQSAGDQFCQLMTPQDLYDYVMQVDNNTVLVSPNGYFGISVSHYGIGLYVTSISTDGSCYGIFKTGDIILKFKEMKTKSGTPVKVDAGEFSEMTISDYDWDVVDEVFAQTYSAKFVYLRSGELYETEVIKRGNVGFPMGDAKSKYKFIEYYFDNDHNNISVQRQNNASYSTYQLRGLENLPKNTGYIRISQFMYYMDDINTEVTAFKEFLEVMQIFRQLNLKRLVLDLKGNPGGRVDVVCNIASLLITDAKLTSAQKSQVAGGGKGLKITYLVPRKGKAEVTYCESHYDDYFGVPTEKCDIVIWTDSGSASASELLTGALTDYATGFQIGSRTYGKGIAQSIKVLKNYSGAITPIEGDNTRNYYWAIYYTYAEYFSPLGINIHGKGYSPQEGYNNITDYGSKTEPSTLWGATYKYWGLK